MAIRPDLVQLDLTLETDRSLAVLYGQEPAHLARRAQTPNKYHGTFTGVDDGSNDPELTASRERGQRLLELIASRLAERATALFAEVFPGRGGVTS